MGTRAAWVRRAVATPNDRPWGPHQSPPSVPWGASSVDVRRVGGASARQPGPRPPGPGPPARARAARPAQARSLVCRRKPCPLPIRSSVAREPDPPDVKPIGRITKGACGATDGTCGPRWVRRVDAAHRHHRRTGSLWRLHAGITTSGRQPGQAERNLSSVGGDVVDNVRPGSDAASPAGSAHHTQGGGRLTSAHPPQ